MERYIDIITEAEYHKEVVVYSCQISINVQRKLFQTSLTKEANELYAKIVTSLAKDGFVIGAIANNNLQNESEGIYDGPFCDKAYHSFQINSSERINLEKAIHKIELLCKNRRYNLKAKMTEEKFSPTENELEKAQTEAMQKGRHEIECLVKGLNVQVGPLLFVEELEDTQQNKRHIYWDDEDEIQTRERKRIGIVRYRMRYEILNAI